MRPLLMLTLLASPPALAAAPQCALQAPVPIAAVAQRDTPTSNTFAADVPTHLATAPQSPTALPQVLASIPFVQHVASAGATITDFGMSHGVRSISARNGDQFMIFQVTPDGQAAVSGALTEMTAAQLTTAASGNVTPLPAQHGLEGLFVRSGSQFQVFYVTPDKERVVPGVLWDMAGKDLTRDQVANVPGAIPTVVVGNVDPANKDAASVSQARPALPLVEKASFGTVGPASAPHLWMLIDPQCIYSVRAYQMLHPFILAGKLQVSIVPLSVLDYEDNGQSTKSALALLSKPADQLAAAWQAGSVNDPPSPAAADRLRTNMAIAQSIGLQGTPTLVWKKTDCQTARKSDPHRRPKVTPFRLPSCGVRCASCGS